MIGNMYRIYQKVQTPGYTQEGQFDLCQKASKWVHSLDKKCTEEKLVAEWQEEQSIETEGNNSAAYHINFHIIWRTYGMDIYGSGTVFLLIMWMLFVAGLIVKCIGLYSLLTFSPLLQKILIGYNYAVQMDNDAQHTAKVTQEFLKVKIPLDILWDE